MYPTLQQIHFVGVGGIGMSGLAEILLTMGCRVTGSDLKKSPITDRLKRRGARIFIGHRAGQIGAAQVVVRSSAVSRTNPEIVEAHRRGIPVIARGEMLAELMRLKYGIAVAGSHGKTTTTSLVAAVLEAGGLDPTAVIGGRVRSFRSNARLGKGDFLVAEADESDGSFLHLSPAIAVITNIDAEHLDHYGSFQALRKTFADFAQKIPFYGRAVFCADHPETLALARTFGPRGVTYGIDHAADYTAVKVLRKGFASRFEVRRRGETLGQVTLKLPGRHNVLNSLAAIAVGDAVGVRFSDMRRALASFSGIGRRMEVLLDRSVTVVDDYGHHPAEIRATLAAARSIWPRRRLMVLFQPHRYTRTRDLFKEFSRSFGQVDRLLVTEIYGAGEKALPRITGARLATAIARRQRGVSFVPTVAEAADRVIRELKKGDVVLTLGAGDIVKVGRELVRRLTCLPKR